MSSAKQLIPDPNLFSANRQALAARGTPQNSLARLELEKTEPLLAVQTPAGLFPCLREAAQDVRPLEDPDDPQGAARAWVAGLKEVTLPGGHLVLFGLGMGHALCAVLERADEETLIWIVEPCREAAALALGLLDLAPVIRNPRIHWSLGESPEELAVRINQGESLSRLGGQGLNLLVTPFAKALQPQATQAYAAAIGGVVQQAKLNIESNAYQQVHSLENMKASLPLLTRRRGTGSLWGVLAGRPAIVLGAGPSLEDHLERLAEVAPRVAVIAVDTAHRTLRRAGIVPDLVLSIDFTPLNARHLEEGPIENELLVAHPGVHPSIFERFSADNTLGVNTCNILNRAIVGRPLPRILGLETALGSLRTGGSTAHAALSLTRMLGAGPVLLLGVDLSFPGERLYSQGAVQLELDGVDTIGTERIPAPSNDGKGVLTNGMFYRFAQEMGFLAQHQGIDAMNLARQGTVLPGIPYRDWETAIQRLSPTPVNALERIRDRLATCPPVTTAESLRTACLATERRLDECASEFSKRSRAVRKLDSAPSSVFRERFKALVGPIYLTASKDPFLILLFKYVEPSWAQFIGHGGGVGLLGGSTPDANETAKERFEHLLRELVRATKAYRTALAEIRTRL